MLRAPVAPRPRRSNRILARPRRVIIRPLLKLSLLCAPPLSQERAAGRPTSDANDAGLKGEVKRVLTESEKHSGAELVDARSLISDVEFDAQCDWV